MDMSYKNKKHPHYNYTQQITLSKPLQIQTLKPKKYLRCINALQSDDGHMLPILTNYKVIDHTLTY